MSKVPRIRAPKRPVAKSNILITKQDVDTVQIESQIRLSSVSETLAGIRGLLSIVSSGTPAGIVVMAIIKIPEGVNVTPTLSVTDGTNFFLPEEWVLWSVAVNVDANIRNYLIDVNVKAMRKLKDQDRIMFIQRGSIDNLYDMCFAATAFFKQ